MTARVSPEVYIHLQDASWPPANADCPVGVARVNEWGTTREIVGDLLPDNIRARSGLTIGTGKVTVADRASQRLTPWSRDLSQRVEAGVRAHLYAADGPLGERTPLGEWITDDTGGRITGGGVDIDLAEAASAGRDVPAALPPLMPEGNYDAAFIVDTLARRMGYYATPAPVKSCILSAPLQGGIVPEVGGIPQTYNEVQWNRDTGPISMWSEPGTSARASFYTTGPYFYVGDAVTVYLAANVTGWVYFDLGEPSLPVYPCLRINGDGGFGIRNTQDAAWVNGSFTPGLDPNHPTRVEVEIRRVVEVVDDNLLWDRIEARARSSASAPWSPWITESTPTPRVAYLGGVTVATAMNGSAVSGIQMCREPDPGLWDAPTADIDLLGVRISHPFVPAGSDTWAAIQKVCGEALGIAFTTSTGGLRVRNRRWLAGANRAGYVIDVDDHLEELEWSINPDDVIDRVEVTYRPPTPVYGGVFYEASEPVMVPPKSKIEIAAEVTRWDDDNLVTPWVGPTDSHPDLGWVYGNTAPDGSGAESGYDLWAYPLRQLSGRTSQTDVKIVLENRGNVPYYTVAPDGTTALRVMYNYSADQSTEVVVARGVPADRARNPLPVDCGYTIQTHGDAVDVADFIIGRGDEPMWKASSVRVPYDPDRDIGDIVTLRHTGTGLRAKCLVTKVENSGSAEGVEQSIDVVLMPATWLDHDDVWDGHTWADHVAAWGDKTWDEFDDNPLAQEE